jgi:DNA polymerase
VVFHVHDEVVLEVPRPRAEESLHRLVEIMVSPPRWAAGFPVAAEGFASPRYTKGAFRGWPQLEQSSRDVSCQPRAGQDGRRSSGGP